MDVEVVHTFEVNEIKCSETGKNYAPQVYVDGSDNGHAIQLWFAPRPGTTHEQVHDLIRQMHGVLESCHLQISDG